jgi:Domain of unknown function (DUF1816)
MNIQSIWSSLLHQIGRAWWVKITTKSPHCCYYFGPFSTKIAADLARPGYIEDLESELAQGIEAEIERCAPIELTIDYELAGGGTDLRLNPLPI